MILSASRRTDIPAFYMPWLMNRLRAGEVLIQNPYNPNQVSRVRLSPDTVDCIVFWSKNPAPLLGLCDEIAAMGYAFYVQYTLTPYGAALEPGLPPETERLETFLRLSDMLGAQRVVWRYDPVIVSDAFPARWHLVQFRRLAEALRGNTDACIFSFADAYAKLRRTAPELVRTLQREEACALASGFAETAQRCGMKLCACAEPFDLRECGVSPARCIDARRIEQILDCPIREMRDKGQRPACGCMQSIDVGAYDTCPHGCRYCYANRSGDCATERFARHDPAAPMLTGFPRPGQKITDRPVRSLREDQLTF